MFHVPLETVILLMAGAGNLATDHIISMVLTQPATSLGFTFSL